MQLPAPKRFATIYCVLLGIFFLAAILGAEPVAFVAWLLAKLMFFGLALVIVAAAMLGLVLNLIPRAAPATKQRIILEVAPSTTLPNDGVSFAPLEVYGPDYSVTVDPIEGASTTQSLRTRYTYDVQMPSRGLVRITPGNQPTATLDAAIVSQGSGATIYYTQVRKGYYGVSRFEQASRRRDV